MPHASDDRGAQSVYWFAFGYFACYAPYSALTKALSSGLIGDRTVTGLELLPLTTLASGIAMIFVMSALKWWRFASRSTVFGISVPRPGLWTGLSGLATAAIIVTTTLAYTFRGVSIPLVMLLMRGGVLMLAPVVDVLSKRKVRWFSFVALALSMLALLDAFFAAGASAIPFWCAADIGVYLLGYFVRLRFMSRIAKSTDPDVQRKYFVEEQMVAAPAAVVALAALALIGRSPALLAVRRGFTDLWSSSTLFWVILVGLLSQGTGVFGGLVLLDARENTFCVPLNRASSILAGVLAGAALMTVGQRAPSQAELLGAGLLVAAIAALWAGPMIDKRRKGAASA
ncbi:MAG: hypothetical protein U0269_34165 [Polyangiales bacterium]